jgi:hypothetical protein
MTLLLIYRLQKWNGYLLLLTSMTVGQVLYDVNYIFRIFKTDAACYTTMFLDLVGGLGVSFWTNILAFVVTYTVLYCKAINIFKYYPYFSLYGTVVPLGVAIYAVGYPHVIEINDDGHNQCHYYDNEQGSASYSIYYWARFLSVAYTIILCSITLWKLRQMAIGTNFVKKRVENFNLNPDSNAILSTVIRMNYYAIAQALCRSGAAWNEWKKGEYSCFASAVMAAICSPLSGTLNFIIFLVSIPANIDSLSIMFKIVIFVFHFNLQVMQPNAFVLFKCMVFCRPVPEEIFHNPKMPPQKNVGLRTLSNSTSGRAFTTSTSSGFGLNAFQEEHDDDLDSIDRSSDIGFEPNKQSEYGGDVENPMYEDSQEDGEEDSTDVMADEQEASSRE